MHPFAFLKAAKKSAGGVKGKAVKSVKSVKSDKDGGMKGKVDKDRPNGLVGVSAYDRMQMFPNDAPPRTGGQSYYHFLGGLAVSTVIVVLFGS